MRRPAFSTTNRFFLIATSAIGLLGTLDIPMALGQTPATDGGGPVQSSGVGEIQSDWPSATSRRLADYLNRCQLVGRYTNDAGDGSAREERYTISSCKLTDTPEYYDLTVRIQYGSNDVEVPMRLRIALVDRTPIMMVDSLTVPGLGTFDARVVIRNDRYAGTWAHDDHGGHLFGRIEQLPGDNDGPASAGDDAASAGAADED